MQVSKTFRTRNTTANVVFEPGFIQCTGSFQKGPVSVSQTANSQLSFTSEVQANLFNDSLVTKAILEITPELEQSLVDQLQNKPPRLNGFRSNYRVQTALDLDDVCVTGMFNEKGRIAAASFNVEKWGVQVGSEYVNIIDKKQKLYAVGLGYTFKNGAQIRAQANCERSACVGTVVPIHSLDAKVGGKLQLKRTEEGLKAKLDIGLQKTFARGQATVGIKSDGLINADVKAIVGENTLVQVCVNGDAGSGQVHCGVGVVF